MSTLWDIVRTHARHQPAALALLDGETSLGYQQLCAEIEVCAENLDGSTLGLLLDNSPAWIVIDIAAQSRGIPLVPLPGCFTDAQLRHVVATAGVRQLLTDQPRRLRGAIGVESAFVQRIAGRAVHVMRCPVAAAPMPSGTARITFTSGTTGTPKGVCLTADTLLRVAESLCAAIGAGALDSTLSVLPLAILLENVAVTAGLMAGGIACVPSLSRTGTDSPVIDARLLTRAFTDFDPSAVVLVPQLLRLLTRMCEAGWQRNPNLRFTAVGGAAVSATLLERARAAGLPVYEGYGLSEAGSVVSLNRPDAHRPGSVGRPLPHAQVRIAGDGEVRVAGALYSGYLNEPPCTEKFLPTGDLGYLDDDGFLYLRGRKKNMFVTAFGRNVSPEWPESELIAQESIAQAAVFGEARPFNIAIIVPAPGAVAARIERAVQTANTRLPDYARIKRFHLSARPFSARLDELTANGRLKREVIASHFDHVIDALYQEEPDYAVL